MSTLQNKNLPLKSRLRLNNIAVGGWLQNRRHAADVLNSDEVSPYY